MPYRIIFFLLYLSSILPAATQEEIIRAIEQRNNAIFQQEENRQKFLDSQKKNDHFIPTKELEIDEEKVEGALCFQIDTIELHNNEQLEDEVFSSLFASYEGNCLSIQDLNNITKQVTNIYIEHGYVTSRAYLKEQDLNNGHLDIYVLEGKIDSLLMNDKEAREMLTAFPFLEEKVLNIRDLEMGLEQMQRLPSNKVSLDLKPSDKEGYTVVNIVNDSKRPFYTSFSASNMGSESTGKNIGDASLYLDDILGFNEQLMLNANGTLSQKDEKKTKGYGYSFSLPYGYWTMSFGSREYEFRTELKTENNVGFVSSGISETHYGDLKYLFYRDESSKADLKMVIDLKQNFNFISNELIKVSSSKISSGRVFVNYSKNLDRGSFSIGFGVHKGLNLFDPLKDSDDANRKAQYIKYTANLGFSYGFELLDRQFSFYNNTTYQYSPDKLYTPEQTSIGGFYTVRGFEELAYTGDIGGYTRNDLSMHTPTNILDYPVTIISFLGLDAGVVENDPSIYKWLVGSSVGLRIHYGNFSSSLAIDVPISAYDDLQSNKPVVSFSQTFYF